MDTLVIDTNVLISALIKNGLTRNILTNLKINFLFPELSLEDIYFYKKEIIKKAKISENQFYILLLRILKYIKIVPLDILIKFREDADKLIGKIDKEDTIFIATALAFNCPVWSNDKHFKKQNKIKILTTKDMMRLFN